MNFVNVRSVVHATKVISLLQLDALKAKVCSASWGEFEIWPNNTEEDSLTYFFTSQTHRRRYENIFFVIDDIISNKFKMNTY